MRELFNIDTKDYNENGTSFSRPSSRGIIIKDNKVGLIYSQKYKFYKFPGGGIDKGESMIDALIREVKEESGLNVIRESVIPFGHVLRKQKGDTEDVFIQDNYYFLCEVDNNISKQCLEEYEEDALFTLVFTTPNVAICANQVSTFIDRIELQRDSKVLSILVKEGYLKG